MDTSFYDVLRRATWAKHWKPALFWLLVTVITSLVPTAIGMAAVAYANLSIKFVDFFIHGEFTIYCVGLLTVALVTAGRELLVGFPNRPSFIFLAALGLLAAAAFHGLIVGAHAASTTNDIDSSFNIVLTIVFSVIIYIYSIGLAFLVTLVNHYREDLNINELLQAPERRLEEEFDNL